MVAAPNGGYFVQGGNGDDPEEAGPAGSATIARCSPTTSATSTGTCSTTTSAHSLAPSPTARYPPPRCAGLEGPETGSAGGLARLEPPLQKVRQITGLAVLTAPADNQRRRTRHQLHAGETLPQPTRDSEHVIRAVLADRDTFVFADVPANLVGLHRLAAVQRRPYRVRSNALGLGGRHELINELLSLA